MNSEIVFNRVWSMPNSNTFDIIPIKRLIYKYIKDGMISVDPFANKSRICKITNDMNPIHDTDYHMDALDFLDTFNDESVDLILYDPPYSLRQVSECYKNVGVEVTNTTTTTTQSSWRTKHMDKIRAILKPGGIIICFGWNSNGVGRKDKFSMIEIMLVCHGGSHNDTIITVERKDNHLFGNAEAQ